jgi:hypothetical protein
MRIDLPTARVFEPLIRAPETTRYLAAYGSRNGGKSHFFAELLV